ncbi:MAG: DUF2764 family protein [Candidatus Omnitrophota bacterium]|nr:DUF2764 family protein [Candidatus Omnitrophota bacterium]
MNGQNYYIYFICTLPMLHFGMKPPFSYERFLETASRYIPEEDLEILKMSSISGEYAAIDNRQEALKKWHAFDTALRNELVKIRSSRKRVDPAKYLRHDGPYEASIAHIAMNAHRNPSILEGERMLDEDRWKVLDEFEAGHYFDLDILITYAHKLLILERWEKINTAEGPHILEEFVCRKKE